MTQEHMPRLCIGLPVYNGENYVAQAIDSLLAQTFTDFRLIISDNASSDRTAEICRDFSRRDARIDYVRHDHNRGAAWNFNHLTGRARGEYFKWAPHDDLCAPEFTARCIAALDTHPDAVLAYPRSHIIDAHGTIVASYREPIAAHAATPWARFRSVVRNSGLCHSAFGVIRLDVLRTTRLWGPYPASDTVLLAELALRGKFIEVDAPLLLQRDHAARASRVHGSDADEAVWLAPANVGRPARRHWAVLANDLGAIVRAPVSTGQKLRCMCVMAYWSLRRWRPLWNELRAARPAPLGGHACPTDPTLPADRHIRAA